MGLGGLSRGDTFRGSRGKGIVDGASPASGLHCSDLGHAIPPREDTILARARLQAQMQHRFGHGRVPPRSVRHEDRLSAVDSANLSHSVPVGTA